MPCFLHETPFLLTAKICLVQAGDAMIGSLCERLGSVATTNMSRKVNYVVIPQIPVVKSQPREAPWVKEGNMYVITAYFVDPTTICSGTRPSSDYMGDRLLLQTGSSPDKHVAVPFKEEDLAGSKWVKGKCFYGMGEYRKLV